MLESPPVAFPARKIHQRTTEGMPPVLVPPAALLDGHFEHSAGERITYNAEQSGALETGARSSVGIGGRLTLF